MAHEKIDQRLAFFVCHTIKMLNMTADIQGFTARLRMGPYEWVDTGRLHIARVFDLHIGHLPSIANLTGRAISGFKIVANTDGVQAICDGLHTVR